jgi:hypothetical protein
VLWSCSGDRRGIGAAGCRGLMGRHACGIEPSRPPVEHSCSHPQTCQSKSAQTFGSCNSAALSTCCDAIRAGLPPPPVLRCASTPRRITPTPTASCRYVASPSDSPCHNHHLCLREGRGLPASGPCLPLPSPRRPPTFSMRGPLLSCGSARSRRTEAPPIPRATSLHTIALHVVALHNYSSSTSLPCTVTPPRRCRTRGPRPCRAAPARYSAPLPLARGKEAQTSLPRASRRSSTRTPGPGLHSHSCVAPLLCRNPAPTRQRSSAA